MERETRNVTKYQPQSLTEIRGEENAPRISGYAAVFNTVADFGFFRERIAPGAFARALNEKQDVRALVDHNPSLILGRTKAGTLTLREDENGLLSEIVPPDTTLARDTIASMRRGDLDQMSFAFFVRKESWIEEKGQAPMRQIEDVDLLDVSIVAFPAYEETSASVRSKARELTERPLTTPADLGLVDVYAYALQRK